MSGRDALTLPNRTFLSAVCDILLSSVTKDSPHQALQYVSVLLVITTIGKGSPGILADIFGKLLVIQSPLFVSHGDCVMNGVGQLLRVPGIDDQTAI